MRRALPLLVTTLVAALLFWVQGPTQLQLAAMTAGDLLGEPDARGALFPVLGEEVLRNAEELEDGALRLVLAPVQKSASSQITHNGTTYSIAPSAEVRRSVLTNLRSLAAEQGGSLITSTAAKGGYFELTLIERENGDLLRALAWNEGGDLTAAQLAAIKHRGTSTGLAGSIPWTPPSKTSLLPPLVAILLAVSFRRTILALFVGVWVGATVLVLQGTTSPWLAVPVGFYDVFAHFLWGKVYDLDNTRTALFVLCMLSMVGLLIRSGGIRGLMDAIASRAKSARSTQVATWILGLAIFFDDYSNTVLVGSTMRPLTDRFRIAREKLAYLVDSTAAPVAGLSLLSTWIAFEVSTFSAQLPAAGISPTAGYEVFLATLPFRFYCILTLVFVGLVVFTGRDFGPMLKAERRARKTGELVAPGSKPLVAERANSILAAPGVPPRALHAIVPLLAFVFVTFFTILLRGGAFEGAPDGFSMEWLSGVLLSGSGSIPLLVGSATGLTLAALVCLRVGIGREIPSAAWTILSSMGSAFAILYLAWMIGMVCGELGTAHYLTGLIGDAIHPATLPAILFLLSSAIAFATGSSWSTMMILLPLVVGLAFNLGEAAEIGGYALLIMSIGAVLEGSIFGDHCSPISDTTILSSVSSASDHMDHVKTQAPYALLTMSVAMGCCYLPCALFGLSPWVGIGIGAVVLAVVLLACGRRAEAT